MDPTYPLAPLANFLACFLILISLSPAMTRSLNIGVCSYALWVFLECFVTAIDTIVWSDNANNVAPIWCDITSHIGMGSLIGFPASTFFITRRLYKISCLRGATSPSRFALSFDLFICLGLPIIVMILYYVVQGVRFQIVEEYGCGSAVEISGVSIILIQGWPILLPATSVIFYFPRIVWTLYRRRKEMNEALDSHLSAHRSNYYRMLALGSLDTLISLPLTILNLVQDVLLTPIVFYQGWSAIHSDWAPQEAPESEWKTFGAWFNFSIQWDKWVHPLLAMIFFLLFGLTSEARARYWNAFWFVVKPLGIKRPIKPEASDVAFGTIAFQPVETGSSRNSQNEDQGRGYAGFDAIPRAEKGLVNSDTDSASPHSNESELPKNHTSL